jgi:hypothetical protein
MGAVVKPVEDHREGFQQVIVMCNFLTQSAMTDELADELSDLAGSLTPGGVMLVLGGTSPKYEEIYSRLDGLVVHSYGRSLKRVASVNNIPAQPNQLMDRMVADELITNLSTLRRLASAAFAEKARSLPADVRMMDPLGVELPNFALRAFKREGGNSFTKRESPRFSARRRDA